MPPPGPTPPPPLPSPYSLSARRLPGQPPQEILSYAPHWALFLDHQSGLKYYLSRTNGECTYGRPPEPIILRNAPSPPTPTAITVSPTKHTELPDDTEEHFKIAMESKGEDRGEVVLPPPASQYPATTEGFDDDRFGKSGEVS